MDGLINRAGDFSFIKNGTGIPVLSSSITNRNWDRHQGPIGSYLGNGSRSHTHMWVRPRQKDFVTHMRRAPILGDGIVCNKRKKQGEPVTAPRFRLDEKPLTHIVTLRDNQEKREREKNKIAVLASRFVCVCMWVMTWIFLRCGDLFLKNVFRFLLFFSVLQR